MNTRPIPALAAAGLLALAPAAMAAPAQTGSTAALRHHPLQHSRTAPKAQQVAAPADGTTFPSTVPGTRIGIPAQSNRTSKGVTVGQASAPTAPSAGTTQNSAAAVPGTASTPAVKPSASSGTTPSTPGGATANNTAPVGNAASNQNTNH